EGNTSTGRTEQSVHGDETNDSKTGLARCTRRVVMRKHLTYAVAILVLGAVTTLVFAERTGTNTASAHGRYLPEYTKEGDLILPMALMGIRRIAIDARRPQQWPGRIPRIPQRLH